MYREPCPNYTGRQYGPGPHVCMVCRHPYDAHNRPEGDES